MLSTLFSIVVAIGEHGFAILDSGMSFLDYRLRVRGFRCSFLYVLLVSASATVSILRSSLKVDDGTFVSVYTSSLIRIVFAYHECDHCSCSIYQFPRDVIRPKNHSII